jgi:hypothetical protein
MNKKYGNGRKFLRDKYLSLRKWLFGREAELNIKIDCRKIRCENANWH